MLDHLILKPIKVYLNIYFQCFHEEGEHWVYDRPLLKRVRNSPSSTLWQIWCYWWVNWSLNYTKDAIKKTWCSFVIFKYKKSLFDIKNFIVSFYILKNNSNCLLIEFIAITLKQIHIIVLLRTVLRKLIEHLLLILSYIFNWKLFK